MKGIDTNVLLRSLLDDDPKQGRLAKEFLDRCEAAGERVFVSTTVLCELAWTLRSKPLARTRQEIAAAIQGLLGVATYQVAERDLVREALAEYMSGRADFADHLLGLQALANGCTGTVTFDRRLRGRRGFEILG